MLFVRESNALQWTAHSRGKMRFYGLSEQRVRRVIHSPKRIEEGIAPDTIAIMQPVSITKDGRNETWKQEIWVMVQKKKRKEGTHETTRVISAWRYPGRTKPGDPLPLEVMRELKNLL